MKGFGISLPAAREVACAVREEALGNLGECIGLLKEAIRFESFSGKEGPLARMILDFLRKNGIPAFIDIRGSVVAILAPDAVSATTPSPEPGTDDRRIWEAHFQEIVRKTGEKGIGTLAYNAHMDVVEPGDTSLWKFPPFSGTVEDGRFYGRGSCDMKGAMASMVMSLVLAKRLRERFPLRRTILGCFVTEEEVAEGLAFMEIIRTAGIRPDAVLLGEPSKMEIARGQRGKLQFRIVGRGKRVHSSVPEEGENAAYKVAKAVSCIEEMERREFARVGPDPAKVLGRSTFVVTAFHTVPFDRSSVPDRAEAEVTVRLAEGADFSRVREELRGITGWPDVEIELRGYDGDSYSGRASEWSSEHRAWQLPRDHDFFRFMDGAFHLALERKPADKIWPFSTDGVFSAGEERIPTLGIGPGREEVAHQIDEHVSLKDLQEALTLYTFLPFA